MTYASLSRFHAAMINIRKNCVRPAAGTTTPVAAKAASHRSGVPEWAGTKTLPPSNLSKPDLSKGQVGSLWAGHVFESFPPGFHRPGVCTVFSDGKPAKLAAMTRKHRTPNCMQLCRDIPTRLERDMSPAANAHASAECIGTETSQLLGTVCP